MAGVLGFEPRDAEIKTRCLTAWRYPNTNFCKPKWCGTRDLNPHTSRRQNLNLVRLPISPVPQMVATARFELATPTLWVLCSNQLSYVAILFCVHRIGLRGALCWFYPCSSNVFSQKMWFLSLLPTISTLWHKNSIFCLLNNSLK